VIIWDEGIYAPIGNMETGLQKGHIAFVLHGSRLIGEFSLVTRTIDSPEPLIDFPLIMDEYYQYPNSVVKMLKKNGYSAETFHGNSGWFYKRVSAYTAAD
jgi:hypothetical protein